MTVSPIDLAEGGPDGARGQTSGGPEAVRPETSEPPEIPLNPESTGNHVTGACLGPN